MTILTIVIRILMIISLVELSVMLLFSVINLQTDVLLTAIIDALLLSILSTPFIYYWVIKPFVVARDKAEQKVMHLALHDVLTGLPNRRLLLAHLENTVAYCTRNKVFGALLFIDLDKFKPINDQYGHAVGDTVLVEVAKNLKALLRKTDIAVRLGGDEFIILFSYIADEQTEAEKNSSLLVRKVTEAIVKPFTITNINLNINASIGIRLITPNEQDLEKMISDADKAMYEEKQYSHSKELIQNR